MITIISRIVPLVCVALAAGLPSQAEVHFYVKNCTDHKIPYWTFDGADSLRLIQADHGTIPAFAATEETGDANYHKLSCATGSKCQFYMEPADFFGKTFKYNIKQGAHMRIIALEEFEYDVPAIAARKGTQYILRYTLSTESDRCDEAVENPASLNGS